MRALDSLPEVTGVSGHAQWRYRDRVDARCEDSEAAVMRDLQRGGARLTAPTWLHAGEPADFYICVDADEQAAARCYVVRHGLVITLVLRPDEAETDRARRQAGRHARRRHLRH